MSNAIIYSIAPVDTHLNLKDPLLFTVHHHDRFLKGSAALASQTTPINVEYEMYFGEIVPGFPEHPHTGLKRAHSKHRFCDWKVNPLRNSQNPQPKAESRQGLSLVS
ncbi:hypothetical protein [Acinetobacter sp. WZC-1]|uniref:hypothetical protein n=1 Tax=Acinetobacter sp. WZC-1 TaxID=3459034 RepID=UPI00403DFB6F